MSDITLQALGGALSDLGNGAWYADLAKGVVTCNRRAAQLLGIGAGEVLTMERLQQLRPWPDLLWKRYEAVFSLDSGNVRCRFFADRRADGSVKGVLGLEVAEAHVEERTAPSPVSDVAAYADAVLLHDVLSIQPALMSRFTLDGHVVWCNEAYAAFAQSTVDQVVGRRWVDLTSELGHDSRESIERLLRAIVQSTEHGTSTSVSPWFTEGTTRWLQWINRRLPETHDGVAIIQCVGVEVTELRAMGDALNAMASELARVRLAERRDIARRLHDDVVQVLVSANWELASSEDDSVVRSRELVTQAVDQLRLCLSELTSPPVLPGRLADAIVADVELAQQAGIDVVLDVGDVPREELRTVAARVLGEGLRNAARHSGAHQVTVSLHVAGTEMVGSVVDDGVGVTEDDLTRALASGHIGVLTSRAMVEALGGEFWLRGVDDRAGTHLAFRIPLMVAN